MQGKRYGEQPPLGLTGQWLILWDGDCGFCRRSVQAVLRHPRAQNFLARPWQGETAWLPQSVIDKSGGQFHLRSPEGVWLGGGDAAIGLLAALGNQRMAALLGLPPLRQGVAGGYRLVARHRHLFSRLF